MNIIGQNIRKLRKAVGLTQIEFAKQINVSQGTLSDIEQGNCNPSMDTILSIHNQFEVTLDWLLKGSQRNSSHQIIMADLSSKELQLLNILRQMKPEDKEELLQYALIKSKHIKS
ncbi:helix-turn-helix domain-containing protein [Paenibacillus macquariensis]|uniref:Transcriptional regulator, contains XRE-family HTH domain n=1 Tax=Paenibacillus macquariensis TaxID=948756 RepID=A0ABY1K908_9BACL|nr:helix-turn-helix transcriptional regulator [Paenibacillus macquariensis]MEC0091512.1 helix-turn-helix transcriptional regulator [Paenibacillus macquariensis]OAB26644.1 hypothetical protein PMSM_26110 [Paenibacillus macquariensis subsp. macquariensis]SIR43920.1 Transcriptional regulator, contains XRE-family HTH domain [Paenibacillus macquariensis]